MKKIALLLGSFLVILSCGSYQQNSSKQVDISLVDPVQFGTTITSDELKDKLYTYASDEFEGRETGEPGQKMAVNYLKNHYVNLNIASPLGGDDYFQEVPLEKQKSPDVNLNVNGNSFEKYTDFVAYGSADTQKLNVSEIVFVGYGIEDENYSDYTNLDVKGKVVLAKEGEPKTEDGIFLVSKSSESSKWSNGRQGLTSKKDVADKHGAKAFFILDNGMFTRYAQYYAAQDASGKSGRISLKSTDPQMLNFLISENLAKTLYPNILEDNTPKIISASLELDLTSKSEQLSSENVVAYIKGSEKPDEVIVISAHLDHEGIKDGLVYNGADDDGSGTVAVMEIAEAFKAAVNKGFTPKRSILFLHVTGEEKGLLGSRHYTDNDPIFPLENTVADLNIDMIGRVDDRHTDNRNFVYLIGSDKLSTELHELSEAVNAKYANVNLDYTYNDENDKNRYYYRSDHYNFAKNNVPVIFYFNGTHDDYHKPTDTPDKIQYDLLENRTRLVFYTAWELANRPNRIKVDKYEVTASE
jgi:Zn-dependent M28 family amino/carboxypeptidase